MVTRLWLTDAGLAVLPTALACQSAWTLNSATKGKQAISLPEQQMAAECLILVLLAGTAAVHAAGATEAEQLAPCLAVEAGSCTEDAIAAATVAADTENRAVNSCYTGEQQPGLGQAEAGAQTALPESLLDATGDRATEDAEVLELAGIPAAEVYARIQAQESSSRKHGDGSRTGSHSSSSRSPGIGRKLAFFKQQYTHGFAMRYTLSFYFNASSASTTVAQLSNASTDPSAIDSQLKDFAAGVLGSLDALMSAHSMTAYISSYVPGNPLNVSLTVYPMLNLHRRGPTGAPATAAAAAAKGDTTNSYEPPADPSIQMELVDRQLADGESNSSSLFQLFGELQDTYSVTGLRVQGTPENAAEIADCREFVRSAEQNYWGGSWTSAETALVVMLPLVACIGLVVGWVFRARRRAAASGTVAGPVLLTAGPMMLVGPGAAKPAASAAASKSGGGCSNSSSCPSPATPIVIGIPTGGCASPRVVSPFASYQQQYQQPAGPLSRPTSPKSSTHGLPVSAYAYQPPVCGTIIGHGVIRRHSTASGVQEQPSLYNWQPGAAAK